jgi:hypothetical protein
MICVSLAILVVTVRDHRDRGRQLDMQTQRYRDVWMAVKKTAVVREFLEALSTGHSDAIRAAHMLFSPDFVGHLLGDLRRLAPTIGYYNVETVLNEYFTQFGHTSIAVEDTIVQDNLVAVRFLVHSSRLQSSASAGTVSRPLGQAGVAIVQFVGEKIVKFWIGKAQWPEDVDRANRGRSAAFLNRFSVSLKRSDSRPAPAGVARSLFKALDPAQPSALAEVLTRDYEGYLSGNGRVVRRDDRCHCLGEALRTFARSVLRCIEGDPAGSQFTLLAEGDRVVCLLIAPEVQGITILRCDQGKIAEQWVTDLGGGAQQEPRAPVT